MGQIVKVDDKKFKISINAETDKLIFLLNDQEITAEILSNNSSHLTLLVDNKLYTIIYDSDNRISVNGEEYITEIFDEQVQKLIKTNTDAFHKKEETITAPMPGLIIEIEVEQGSQVAAGQGVIIMEAMKMQNEMKAPLDGTIKKIFVRKGQTVDKGDTLISIFPV